MVDVKNEVGLFARIWMELGIMILSQKPDVVSHVWFLDFIWIYKTVYVSMTWNMKYNQNCLGKQRELMEGGGRGRVGWGVWRGDHWLPKVQQIFVWIRPYVIQYHDNENVKDCNKNKVKQDIKQSWQYSSITNIAAQDVNHRLEESEQ